jgi:hypothetical protein
MKNAFLFLLCFMFLASVSARAQNFTSEIQDWNETTSDELNDGVGCILLDDGMSSSYEFPYTLTVDFNPPADSITYAELHLVHSGNTNTNGEMWVIKDGVTKVTIGSLSKSNEVWVDQKFILSSDLYSSIEGNTWTLGLTLSEGTRGRDKIYLDKSYLQGTYNTPLPASIFLLAPGVLGLIGLRMKGKMLSA